MCATLYQVLMKTIFNNHTKLEYMYEKKEINLIDVSFIFHKILASRQCVLWGPKIDFVEGGGRSHGPGFLNCWAIGPQVKNSKMITAN